MNSIQQAFIMAAGKGTRLVGPMGVSSKALCPLGGHPLLDWVVRIWKVYQTSRICVVRRHDDLDLGTYIKKSEGIVDCPCKTESTFQTLLSICEFAGGKPFGFSPVDVIAHPSWLSPFFAVFGGYMPKESIVTVTKDIRNQRPTFIQLNESNEVVDIGKDLSQQHFVLAGYYYISPEGLDFFSKCGPQAYSSATRAFRGLVASGRRMRAIVVSGVFDVDTPEELEYTEHRLGNY